MSEVTVNFNNQNYHLACKDGEEDRLTTLAELVDSRAAKIAEKMGSVTDARLLLMTAILIADELDEALGGKTLEESGARNRADFLEETLDGTMKRIEEITRMAESENKPE